MTELFLDLRYNLIQSSGQNERARYLFNTWKYIIIKKKNNVQMII